MEKWQKRYLTAKLPQLYKLTISNETLLARLSADDLLSTADLDTIRSKCQELERTRLLYDILQTRIGGYGAMSRALSEGKQSGAYDIFRQGYIECLPHALNISFHGENRPLSKYLSEVEIREVVLKHIDHFENDGPELETIQLLKHEPPPSDALYIPRKLLRRNVVDTEVFQVKSSDTFVFKGIHSISKLVELVRPQIASRSSSQVQQQKISCRFILLEDDEDWKEICDMASASVHLIKYEEETRTCVLERTYGKSVLLRDKLKRIQQDDTAISEDAFINSVINDSSSGVCICDLPGMGKTLLLAKISDKVKEKYPDRVVVFIPLSQFINSVASNGIPPHLNKELAQKFLVKYLVASTLAQDILDKMLLKGEIQFELFFDAFDEVPLKFNDLTKKLLIEFATKFSNTRIYVTSRPHMRQELEDCLGVFSYDILPFTESNQLQFLVHFWESQDRNSNGVKLHQFAKHILEKLKTSLSKEEQKMTGIPLQCRLLAQVYSKSAKFYSTRANVFIEESCQFEGSLPQLYRKYVEESFDKLNGHLEDVSIFQVKKYHVWMAFKTLFPNGEPQPQDELMMDMPDSVRDLSISMGILERRNAGNGETVEFVHRTFAEYFVSEFVAQILYDSEWTKTLSIDSKYGLVEFLLKEALMTREIRDGDEVDDQVFLNSVIVYFLNFFIDYYRPFTSIHLLAQQLPVSVSPNHLHSIFLGLARNNHFNLLNFIHEVLLLVDKISLFEYKKETLPSENPQRIIHLLNVAAVFSSHSFMEKLFTLAQQCFEYDLSVVCKEMPLHLDTPLHFAVERGDEEMVQFFATHIALENRNLLLSCVIKSNDDPPQIVNKKIEICKMLLNINRNLLTEASYTLYDSVHVDLIKVLIESGADVRATKSGKNIFHRSAKYMRSRDYHELCRFLIEYHKAEDIFLQNEPNWKSPLPYIFREQKNMSIETCRIILSIPGVDVNERDGQGNNLFLIAVQEKHDMKLLDVLVNSGVDQHAINVKGRNALHFAAQAKNIPILTFLINLDLDCCLQDFEGNSFLHLFASKETTADEYHEIISLLSANQSTCTLFHMRNRKEQLPIHLAVDHLEVKEHTLKLFKSTMVDFNAVDNEGCSVLLYAAKAGSSVHFLRTLIEMGADIMKRNKYGETFTHLISKYYSAEQYHELVIFLISKGLEEAFRTIADDGTISLHFAALNIELLPETLELIHRKLVIENKVDINITDNGGWSILMCAAEGKRSRIFLKSLLDMGADVMIQNNLGRTFAHYVAEHYSSEEHYEIIKILIDRGYEKVFHLTDVDGSTCLHWAVAILDFHQATWDLIRRKLIDTWLVNINSPDKNGCTILMSSTFFRFKVSRYTPITFEKWKQPENTFLSYRSIKNELKTNVIVAKRCSNYLRILMNIGADIYIQNKQGNTFSHLFSWISTPDYYHQMVDFLISRGEQKVFTVVNEDGETPIHVAVELVELQKATFDLFNSELFQTNIVDINSTDKNGNTILMHAAIGKRSVGVFKTLIEMGADIYFQNKNGDNFAHEISSYSSPDHYHKIVEFLLSRGEQKVFTVVNEDGETPIHVAVELVELQKATFDLFNSELFQTNIVDINSTDKKGNTILLCAAVEKRSVGVLKTLIEMGADIYFQNKNGENFAHYISFYDSGDQYHEMVEFLIRRGEQKVFSVVNIDGATPIHSAVVHVELQKATFDLFNSTLFQTNIVDINSTDKKGNTILFCAALGKRSVGVLKTLIEMGADIYIQDKDGDNFAHYISFYDSADQYHEMVEFLIRRGEQKVFSVVNTDGRRPIHAAVYDVELLLETLDVLITCCWSKHHQRLCTPGQETYSHGPNSVDNHGVSVLHWAVRGKRSLRFVKHLISLGADWSVKCNHNCSSAHYSASFGLIEHLKYFVELGCDVNALDNDGDNVLQCAVHDATENVYEMVMFLLEKGVDKYHKNKKQQNAYDYAIEKVITDKRILDALK